MTPKKTIILYPGHPAGEIKAHVVGSFMRHGATLYVVRPGYDAQGRSRASWTQIVHNSVPIWEHKLRAPLTKVLSQFDALWRQTIGNNKKLSREALDATRAARMRTYKDGMSGVEPAAALSRDGRGDGIISLA